ncbi:MAG: hypothetical protein ABJE47_18975 [bacterium]
MSLRISTRRARSAFTGFTGDAMAACARGGSSSPPARAASTVAPAPAALANNRLPGGVTVAVIAAGDSAVPMDMIKLATAFGMNPCASTNLSNEQIGTIAPYVYSLSHH